MALYEQSGMVDDITPQETAPVPSAIAGAIADSETQTRTRAEAVKPKPAPIVRTAPNGDRVARGYEASGAVASAADQRIELFMKMKNAGLTPATLEDGLEGILAFVRDPEARQAAQANPQLVKAFAEVSRYMRTVKGR